MKKQNLLEIDFDENIFMEIFPQWKGCNLEITQLSGGITNKLYRVKSEKGDVTVRIYGDKTELFINRDFEIQALEEMAKIGVASKVISYVPEIGVTIVEFIGNSIVLNNGSFLDKTLYPKIVRPIRKIHNSKVKLKKTFDPLVEVGKMASILEKRNVKYPEFDIQGTIKRLEKLYSIINIPENDFVACHNDLLADNFIMIKEEYKHKYDEPMYIIDWEYAGMAPRYYDIADMFQEVLIPKEAEKLMLKEYCEDYEFDKILYYTDLFKPFPDIFWFLWSLIQLNISTIEFDFYNYGETKYNNAQQNIEFLSNEYSVSI